MVSDPLPFEQAVHELELAIARLEATAGGPPSDELKQLRREHRGLVKKVYDGLSAWETVLVARHPKRPQFLDYADLCFDDFAELHGDRAFGDDRAIRTGFARVGDFRVMLIGHHKGRTLAERQQCFYGCAHPEGYRKALAKMRLAAKFKVPVVCLIDTPGAYPGIGAEERGQAQLIATSILEMSRLPTPVVCVVIGEGGSGGALGIGVGDRVSVLQHAYYSVISPEGCAGILWKVATDETKPRAAAALKMTGKDLRKHGIVDDVIPEPLGGAHRSPREAAGTLKTYLLRYLRELDGRPTEQLLADRYEKFRRLAQSLRKHNADYRTLGRERTGRLIHPGGPIAPGPNPSPIAPRWPVRAVVFDHPGRPEDVLHVRDLPTPTPSGGEVLVRMIASPVNPSDLMYVDGSYGLKPRLPATPGFEGVGVVEANGGGLLGWYRKGRRVSVLNDANGNWAEYTIASARRVIPVPDDIPDDQAASFFVNPATAWAITRRVLRVPAGDWLLQTAAGSELGKMVIRLGRRYGFRTVNAVRRREQVEELKGLGADAVVCTADGPVPELVRAATGGGVRFAMDPVGGPTAAQSVAALAPGGRLVLYGTLSGESIPLEPRTLIAGRTTVEGFWLGHFMKGRSIPQTLRLIRRVRGLMREGVLQTHVTATYPLDQVRDAVRHAATPGKGGKVLLRIADR